MKKNNKLRQGTLLATASLDPQGNHGIPNPPIYRASTIISDNLAQYRGEEPQEYDYGRVGTPTSEAFEQAVAALYGADDVVTTPSGLSAINIALMAFAKAGDHVLLPDSIYGTSRAFITKMLTKWDVEIEFYRPRMNEAVASLIKDNTSILYLESPGSLTFEVQDVPAMVKLAQERGILTMIDNTWGTAINYNALSMGVDVIIEAATKYITGHSDVNLGIICARGKHAVRLRQTVRMMGICAGPEDLYLGVRGLRTMAMRLKQSGETGIALAEFVEHQKAVDKILHPALASYPDHALYQRDFKGSCGLFGFTIHAHYSQEAIDKAAQKFEIFQIGASWGGFESLFTQAVLDEHKRAFPEDVPKGYLMRVYAGLEDQADLRDDLARFFEALED